MKLRIISDLHLDINRGFKLQEMANEKEQVLVIAGDICPFIYKDKTRHSPTFFRFLSEMKKRFKDILWVPGNHEFYGSCLYNSPEKVTPSEIFIEGNRIIRATLWSDFEKESPISMIDCKYSINDFRRIYKNKRRETIGPKELLEEHKKHKAFIQKQLNNGAKTNKRIVITHHVPSYRSIASQYSTSKTTGSFVSDLPSLVEQSDVWIHGHTHSFTRYLLGNCDVICNTVGYHWENSGFDPYLVLEI